MLQSTHTLTIDVPNHIKKQTIQADDLDFLAESFVDERHFVLELGHFAISLIQTLSLIFLICIVQIMILIPWSIKPCI